VSRTDLLDRTVVAIAARARWFLLAEEIPDRNGFLQSVAPGVKLVGVVALVTATVVQRDLVADDRRAIRRRVDGFCDDDAVDAVVTTGGTGVTPDDVTVEAVEELFDRELPGFGERFRARSVAEVGPHALVSRATAGIADRTPAFCLPGSENAAAFGTEELIVPIVGHVVGLVAGGPHGHAHGHDHGGDSHGHDHDEDHGGHDHDEDHGGHAHDHGGDGEGGHAHGEEGR